MVEILLVAACLALFTAFGYPLVLWLRPGVRLLAAPAMGISAIAATCSCFAYLGLAVNDVALPMLGLLGSVIAGIAWTARKARLAAGESLALSLGVTWPLILAGFVVAAVHLAWPYLQVGHETYFAYVNPDGWSYLCGADFLRENSANDILDSWQRSPTAAGSEWIQGSVDSAQLWAHPWLLDCAQTVVQRIGQYLLLGFVAETLGFADSFYLLIPVALAIAIASAGPLILLVRAGGLSRQSSVVAGLVWLFSPMLAFTYYYLFFSQQIGLCLGPLILAMLLESRRKGVAANLSLVIAWAGLWACYPEIVPFIGLFAVFLALASSARMRELIRLGSLSVAGVLVLNFGAVVVLDFLYRQTIGGVGGTNRPGEGVFPFGATLDVLPFWMGLIINLLFAHALATWAVVVSLILVPVLVLGLWNARGLRLAAGGLAVVSLLIWGKLAWLDDYPYAATKVAIFTAWLVPIAIAGLWEIRLKKPGLVFLRLSVVGMFLVAGIFYGRLFALRSLPTPGTSIMDPHFNADEQLVSLRDFFDGEEGLTRASREGVMVDVRGWSDTLWVCYWLRRMELGLWRAQPLYLGRDVNTQEDHHQFHRRDFKERYLVRDLSIHGVLHRDNVEPIRSSGRFGLFAFENFYDWDHAERDDFPFPRLGPIESTPQGTRRQVWKKVRLRCVRLGPRSRRLRMTLAPVQGELQVAVKIDGERFRRLDIVESEEFVLADLPLKADGIHMIELEVVGAPERSFGDPADFSILSFSLLTDDAWAETFERHVELLGAEKDGLAALRAEGIYTDLWLEARAKVTLRAQSGDRQVLVTVEVPSVAGRGPSELSLAFGVAGKFGQKAFSLPAGRHELVLPITLPEGHLEPTPLLFGSAGGVVIEPDTRTLFVRVLSLRVE